MNEEVNESGGCANTLPWMLRRWFDEPSLSPRVNYNVKAWQPDFILQLSSIKSAYFSVLLHVVSLIVSVSTCVCCCRYYTV